MIPKALAKKLKPGNQIPYLRLFTPDANATWLITEYDPETGLMFGLCDLGLGFPELGYVSLQEIKSVRGVLGLPVERDRYWTPSPTKTIEEYLHDQMA